MFRLSYGVNRVVFIRELARQTWTIDRGERDGKLPVARDLYVALGLSPAHGRRSPLSSRSSR